MKILTVPRKEITLPEVYITRSFSTVQVSIILSYGTFMINLEVVLFLFLGFEEGPSTNVPTWIVAVDERTTLCC